VELAYNEVNKCNWDEKDLVAYEEGVMDIYKKEAILAQRLDDAKKEGIRIGKEKGNAKGKIEGKVEGRAEGRTEGKIEVAKNLLKAGVTIEVIVENTGLTMDEIKLLMKD
jgi:predicted transposase/invertase (TIGR01784 family)